jgi:two-component system, NarL family, sensor kinase
MDVSTRVRRSGLTVVATVGTVLVLAAFVAMLVRQRPIELYYELFLFHNGPAAIVLLWMARLVLRRQPRHGAGLVLFSIGIVDVLHVVAAVLTDVRAVAAGLDFAVMPDVPLIPADLPLDVAVAHWFMSWLWVPAPILTITLLPLVFPDGRLPGERWRWVVGMAAAGMLLIMAGFAIVTWPTVGADEPTLAGLLVDEAVLIPGGLAVIGAAVASVVALVRRWRRSEGVRRRQFRLVGTSALAMVVVGIVAYPWQPVWIPAGLVAFNALLVTYALAVARYRLHDVEPVLGRAAIGALLAAVVVGIYLAVVVGVGTVAGREGNTLLPLVAVGTVALIIEPARRRARWVVDRLLYGRDTDRAEVLSRLATRASTPARTQDVLEEVADLLVRSSGATRAEVWLDAEPVPRMAAAAGTESKAAPALRAAVLHHGERLGELRLYAWAVADLVKDARQLLDDVAHTLGVVLANARLAAQLRAQLDELQASRRRLVEVQEETRRGLERDIHDGAQARLISLRLRLGLARALAESGDSAPLVEQLDALGREVDAAIRALRQLARGLYPPILEESGLAAALRAHVRGMPVTVAVTAEGLGRYPRAVEGALYFACLEAIQNAAHHSGADTIAVELDTDATTLRFCVRDDGVGFDPVRVVSGAGLANIDDRVSALGGHTRVDSAPGRGTRVSGEVPVQPVVDAR